MKETTIKSDNAAGTIKISLSEKEIDIIKKSLLLIMLALKFFHTKKDEPLWDLIKKLDNTKKKGSR